MKHFLEKKSSPLYTWKTPLRNLVVQWLGLCPFTAEAPVQSLVGELRFQKLQRVAKQTKKDASHSYGLRWLSMSATSCQKAESWMMRESPLHAPGSALLHKLQGGRPGPGTDPHCQQPKSPYSPIPSNPPPASGVSSVHLYSGHIGLMSFFFNFLLWKISNIYKNTEKSKRNLHALPPPLNNHRFLFFHIYPFPTLIILKQLLNRGSLHL